MTERVFTIFRGPDSGRTFVLAESALTLGRDERREVVLHDERASRLHARLLPDGEGAVIADAGSSNGTFVNGAMVRGQRKIAPGDVVAIGANMFVFGREVPSPRQLEKLLSGAAQPVQASGDTTCILEGPPGPIPLQVTPTHLAELMNSLAAEAAPAAEARGVRIAVEPELDPDTVLADREQLHRALAGLLAQFLNLWPAQVEPRETDPDLLTLRFEPDVLRCGFQIEVICIGAAIPRESIVQHGETGAVAAARRIAAAHGSTLHFLPPDSPDTLVRLRLPFAPPREPTTMIHGTK